MTGFDDFLCSFTPADFIELMLPDLTEPTEEEEVFRLRLLVDDTSTGDVGMIADLRGESMEDGLSNFDGAVILGGGDRISIITVHSC